MSLNDTQREVIEWLATGRVGLSSKCMAMWLAHSAHSALFAPPCAGR